MDLPLDVTLELDGDNHVDTKVNSTDDDHQSIPGECKKWVHYVHSYEVQYVCIKYVLF